MDKTALVAIHGYTQDGSDLLQLMGPIADDLREHVRLIAPDAPHVVPSESADRLKELWLGPDRTRWPKHTPRRWWDSSDDGRTYDGFEESVEELRALVAPMDRPILLGFSQGGCMTAALAAMSCKGLFPALRGVVVVAGRAPRAAALEGLFPAPLPVPSLHVWGRADTMMGELPAQLVQRFDPSLREEVIWEGGHRFPRRGQAKDALVEWIRNRALDTPHTRILKGV